jgi:hypothetical protein
MTMHGRSFLFELDPDEQLLESLIFDLSGKRKAILSRVVARRLLRLGSLLAALVFTGLFVFTASGIERYPNFFLPVIPGCLAALLEVINFLVKCDLENLAPLFRAIAQDDAQVSSVRGRIRLELENNGIFDALRQGGVSLMSSSADQRQSDDLVYDDWRKHVAVMAGLPTQ